MKIEYRTPAGTGSYTTLADDTSATLGDKISGWSPELSASPQVEPLPVSGSAAFATFVQARSGVWQIGFVVDREHATPDARLTYVVTHAAVFGIGANFDLKITQGAAIVYLVNAALTLFRPDPHSDKSSVIQYGFVSGTYTTTAPPA